MAHTAEGRHHNKGTNEKAFLLKISNQKYCIAQSYGTVIGWRIDCYRVLVRKMANLQ